MNGQAEKTANQRHGLLAARHLPQWFVAGFAVVYVSGYLIDFYYSSALGVTENGGDLLKLKYIQVGLNFILFLLILSGPSFFDIQHFIGWFFDPSRTKKDFPSRSVRLFIAVFTIAYVLSIYSAFIFTPWNYFQQDSRRIIAILGLIFGGQAAYILAITVIERSVEKYVSNDFTVSIRNPITKLVRVIGKHDLISRIALSGSLILFVGYCDYRAFKGLRDAIYECVITNRGFVFFIICLLFGVLLYRTIERMQKPPINPAMYLTIMVTNLLVIFYLGLVSYAYFIFPYVPNIKGGADFTHASLVSVTLKSSDAAMKNSPSVENAVHVYSTAMAAYFAIPVIGNDACDWRSRASQPKLVQIQQDAIQRVDITSEKLGAENNCFIRTDIKKKKAPQP